MTENAPETAGQQGGEPETGLRLKLKVEGAEEGDLGLEERLAGLHPGHLLGLASRCAVSVAVAGRLLVITINRDMLNALLMGVAVPA